MSLVVSAAYRPTELLFVDAMSGPIQTVMFNWPKQKDSLLSGDNKFTDSSGKLFSG